MTERSDLMRRREWIRWEPAAWPGIWILVVYGFLGLGMMGQPQRYSRTPAYGNLVQVLDIRVWGAFYITVAALFGLYVALRLRRTLAVLVHAAGFVLTGAWLLAMAIRYFTDSGTTNWTTVTLLGALIIIARSASLIPPVTGNLPSATPTA